MKPVKATLLKEIGKRIKEDRESLGMSQAELARRMKQSLSTISYWESGRRGISLDKLHELCDVLKTDPSYIVGYKQRDFFHGKVCLVPIVSPKNFSEWRQEPAISFEASATELKHESALGMVVKNSLLQNIQNDSIILCEKITQECQPKMGDLVVVERLVGDDPTVRTYVLDGGKAYLSAGGYLPAYPAEEARLIAIIREIITRNIP